MHSLLHGFLPPPNKVRYFWFIGRWGVGKRKVQDYAKKSKKELDIVSIWWHQPTRFKNFLIGGCQILFRTLITKELGRGRRGARFHLIYHFQQFLRQSIIHAYYPYYIISSIPNGYKPWAILSFESCLLRHNFYHFTY